MPDGWDSAFLPRYLANAALARLCLYLAGWFVGGWWLVALRSAEQRPCPACAPSLTTLVGSPCLPLRPLVRLRCLTSCLPCRILFVAVAATPSACLARGALPALPRLAFPHLVGCVGSYPVCGYVVPRLPTTTLIPLPPYRVLVPPPLAALTPLPGGRLVVR